jgi:hypothetical protein
MSDPVPPQRPPDSDLCSAKLLDIVSLRDRLQRLRWDLASTEDQFLAEIRALRDLRARNSSHAT